MYCIGARQRFQVLNDVLLSSAVAVRVSPPCLSACLSICGHETYWPAPRFGSSSTHAQALRWAAQRRPPSPPSSIEKSRWTRRILLRTANTAASRKADNNVEVEQHHHTTRWPLTHRTTPLACIQDEASWKGLSLVANGGSDLRAVSSLAVSQAEAVEMGREMHDYACAGVRNRARMPAKEKGGFSLLCLGPDFEKLPMGTQPSDLLRLACSRPARLHRCTRSRKRFRNQVSSTPQPASPTSAKAKTNCTAQPHPRPSLAYSATTESRSSPCIKGRVLVN
ncbi:hypothetical protein L1887_48635 [Cichorium endivia]|nr:hypothetical protein L1887_48635 [Cichorium endivia]